MDKLSELLTEAKPLYRARKRNVAIMKMMVCIFVPMSLFMFAFSVCTMGNDIYVSLNNGTLAQEILEDDFVLIGVK